MSIAQGQKKNFLFISWFTVSTKFSPPGRPFLPNQAIIKHQIKQIWKENGQLSTRFAALELETDLMTVYRIIIEFSRTEKVACERTHFFRSLAGYHLEIQQEKLKDHSKDVIRAKGNISIDFYSCFDLHY